MGALHLTYRPETLDEVIGNKGAVKSIKGILDRETKEIPQAWLFQGPAGCGKTTLARIVRNYLEVSDLNFHEYNSASLRGIDTIREISRNASASPLGGGNQAYLIDEVHQVTGPAQESFLKTLEDSPVNTWFFLATTNPEKLRPAIKSRCTIISVDRVNTKDLKKLITYVLKDLEYEDFPESVIKQIIKNANGACRDALKLLDTVIDIQDENDMLNAVNAAYADETTVKDLWNVLLGKGKPEKKWKEVSKVLKTISGEPEQVRHALLTVLSKNLLDTGDPRVAAMIEAFEDNYFDSGFAGLTLSCYNACFLE